MVGTLLDVAESENRATPSRAELRDLRRAGLSARADSVLRAELRDRVGALSLGAGTALALAAGTGQLWSAWDAQGSPAEPRPDGVVWQILIQPGLWVLAAVAALVGWRAVSRVALIASVPATLIAVVSTDVSFLLRPSTFALVMFGVLALAACVGTPPRRWQLIATGTAVLLIASWLAVLGPFARTYFPRGGLVDLIGSWWPTAVLLVATVVLLVLRRRVAAAAVMIAAAPWLIAVIADQLWFTGVGSEVGYLVRPLLVGAIAMIVPLEIVLLARRYAAPPVGFGPWLSASESSDSPTSASRPSSTR
jgi:hypothetical protein